MKTKLTDTLIGFLFAASLAVTGTESIVMNVYAEEPQDPPQGEPGERPEGAPGERPDGMPGEKPDGIVLEITAYLRKFFDAGFLHRDTVAEEVLVSRQEKALRDFTANGAAAAPRLGEYFFDVKKALMPERSRSS